MTEICERGWIVKIFQAQMLKQTFTDIFSTQLIRERGRYLKKSFSVMHVLNGVLHNNECVNHPKR